VIRRYSAKRAAKRSLRAEVVAEVLRRDGYRCQFSNRLEAVYGRDYAPFSYPLRCDGPLDVHEIIPRSVWRDGYLEPANCVTLCRLAHHRWVDGNPADAYVLGLHDFSWSRPK